MKKITIKKTKNRRCTRTLFQWEIRQPTSFKKKKKKKIIIIKKNKPTEQLQILKPHEYKCHLLKMFMLELKTYFEVEHLARNSVALCVTDQKGFGDPG